MDMYQLEKIEKAQKLVDWLVSNGGYVNPKCTVAFSQYGYELRANGLIKASEVLCMVPKEAQLFATGKTALFEIASSITVEKNKGHESFYHPFLDVLPDDVSYIPAMWEQAKLETIQGTTVHDDVIVMKNAWVEDMYNNGIDQSMVDDMMWARATLQGRAISFPDGLVTFLPYIMFANHNDEPDGNFQYPYPEKGDGDTVPTSTVLLRAKKDYSPGQEISISYGDMSFQQKCLSFGWIDGSINSESICITVLHIGKRTIELKTSMSAAEKLKNNEKLGLQDTLSVKKQLQYVFDAMESEIVPRHKLIGMLERKIEILEDLNTKMLGKINECDVIRQVELDAARFILIVLLGMIQK